MLIVFDEVNVDRSGCTCRWNIITMNPIGDGFVTHYVERLETMQFCFCFLNKINRCNILLKDSKNSTYGTVSKFCPLENMCKSQFPII
jgi:hypothetical protein